jgi:hypothetical protein
MTGGPARAVTRIGQARPSHLMTTAGVGAVVDLPGLSVVVRGLSAWNTTGATIHEPRLLAEIQRIVGPSVHELRAAPWDPSDAKDPWTARGVPVSPFPRWVRCPACSRLGPVDGTGQFEFVHRYGRRPDLAKWVHAGCQKQNNAVSRRRPCIAARFLVVCERGHLDEFPYVEFVHRGGAHACSGPILEMRDSGSTLGPRVNIRCTQCNESRNVSEAAGPRGAAELPHCRGRHPHLQHFEACDQSLRLMVLGASNMWFGITASALHLPQTEGLEEQVKEHWDLLGAQPSIDLVRTLLGGMPALRALRDQPAEDVWTIIERLRAADHDAEQAPPADILDAEWEALSRPTTQRNDEDFLAEPEPVPSAYNSLLDQVVLVKRLREVQALLGFTRVSAPERRDLQPTNLVPLAAGELSWIPAAERRGEGIFLQMKEDAVAQWAEQVNDHSRINALREAYQRWLTNRGRPADPDFPVARYVLLHTLSHLLIRQVSLECGYSSASIRERIYVGIPSAPTAGVLLSTAASDSEGTLGGLVALGQEALLDHLLKAALNDAASCSSDPLCAVRVPVAPSDALHVAACHACLFASETSCETGNRWLDRGVLVDITGDGLSFLQ